MLCQVCHSSENIEDEQHFLLGCPSDSDVRQKHADLFQQAFSVSDFLTNSEPTHVVVFSKSVLCRKSVVSN